MKGRNFLTLTGILSLLMTSCPVVLVVFHSSIPDVRASSMSMSSDHRCEFPEFLQTKRNKPWMMNIFDALTTYDVHGGKIFVREGACIRSRDYTRRGYQSGAAECTKTNYTRICFRKQPGNKYLVRHIQSNLEDKYVCMQFLERGISVVQVKMSLVQGSHFLDQLCSERYMRVDPWPWISEENYRSPPVSCPFTGGYNLLLMYSYPRPAGRSGYYGSKSYYGTSYYAPAVVDSLSNECTDSTTAPIRMDSDCVPGEGIVFNFKHESCLPAGVHVTVRQRALCMATWRIGRESFAMLRADNNDRAFFCVRITMEDDGDAQKMRENGNFGEEGEPGKVKEVMVFFGWVCPTSSHADSVRSSSGTGKTTSPMNSPHVALSVLHRQVIKEPCSDQLLVCHNHTSFCRHLHCMKTCGKCISAHTLAESPAAASRMSKKATVVMGDHFSVRYADNRQDSSSRWDSEGERESMNRGESPRNTNINVNYNYNYNNNDDNDDDDDDNHHQKGIEHSTPKTNHVRQQRCTFPQSIQGQWLRRTAGGVDEEIVITQSTFKHPRLGTLECVTFNPTDSASAPLQRVLWSRYDNGCYPRFTCLHFNTPARSVMRFRLADMQLWPLAMSDKNICDQRHFMEPPDIYQPEDKYTVRSWEVVRRAGHIHKLACILPHYIPRAVTFKDNRGHTGCLVHGTYYSPRDLSLTVFPIRHESQSGQAGVQGPPSDLPESQGESYDVSNGDFLRPGIPAAAGGDSEEDRRQQSEFDFDSKPAWKQNPYDVRGSHRQSQDIDQSGAGGGREVWIQSKDEEDHLHNHKHYHREEADSWRDSPGPREWSEHYRRPFPEGPDSRNWSSPSNRTNTDVHRRKHVGRKGSWQHYSSPTSRNNRQFQDSWRGNHAGQARGRHRRHHDQLSDSHSQGRYSVGSYNYGRRKKRRAVTKETYQCVAVMTYVDSFKSLLTMTSGKPEEVLCWLVVNSSTIVVLKTSSCNSQTARHVLSGVDHSPLHDEHVHRILYLHQGDEDCEAMFPPDPVRPKPIEFRDEDSGAEASLLAIPRTLKGSLSRLTLSVSLYLLYR